MVENVLRKIILMGLVVLIVILFCICGCEEGLTGPDDVGLTYGRYCQENTDYLEIGFTWNLK